MSYQPHFLLLACCLTGVLLAGCQTDPPKTPVVAAAAPATADTLTHLLPPSAAAPAVALTSADAERNTNRDTLHLVGFGVLAVRRSRADAFKRLRDADSLPSRPDSLDNDLSQTAGRVRRQGENLILTPKTGSAITLQDYTADIVPKNADSV